MTVSSSDANDANLNLDIRIGIVADLIAKGYTAAQAKTIATRARGTTPDEITADAKEFVEALPVRQAAPVNPLMAELGRKSDVVRAAESALGAGPSVADDINNRLSR
jgi:hypothetical protein